MAVAVSTGAANPVKTIPDVRPPGHPDYVPSAAEEGEELAAKLRAANYSTVKKV